MFKINLKINYNKYFTSIYISTSTSTSTEEIQR